MSEGEEKRGGGGGKRRRKESHCDVVYSTEFNMIGRVLVNLQLRSLKTSVWKWSANMQHNLIMGMVKQPRRG